MIWSGLFLSGEYVVDINSGHGVTSLKRSVPLADKPTSGTRSRILLLRLMDYCSAPPKKDGITSPLTSAQNCMYWCQDLPGQSIRNRNYILR